MGIWFNIHHRLTLSGLERMIYIRQELSLDLFLLTDMKSLVGCQTYPVELNPRPRKRCFGGLSGINTKDHLNQNEIRNEEALNRCCRDWTDMGLKVDPSDK